MNYSEYVHTYSESFISKYNDFIVNHYIKIEYDGDTIVSIKIINSAHQCIAYNQFAFDIEDKDLYILSLYVLDDRYKGQLIGTFLILLSLEYVYQYTNIIQLSAMSIKVKLDDMSDSARKIKNIYRFAGLHYEERDSISPEMLSSLIHTIRICDYYFKSKIKSKINITQTIFNRNNNFFLGGAEKNLQLMTESINKINSMQDIYNKANIYKKTKTKTKTKTKKFETKVYDIDTEIKQYYIIYNLLKQLKNKFSVLQFIFSKTRSQIRTLRSSSTTKRSSSKAKSLNNIRTPRSSSRTKRSPSKAKSLNNIRTPRSSSRTKRSPSKAKSLNNIRTKNSSNSNKIRKNTI
jgi:hypothetical protein